MAQEVAQSADQRDEGLTDSGRRRVHAGMTFIKVTQLGQQTENPTQDPGPAGASCSHSCQPQSSLPDPQGWSKPQAAPLTLSSLQPLRDNRMEK